MHGLCSRLVLRKFGCDIRPDPGQIEKLVHAGALWRECIDLISMRLFRQCLSDSFMSSHGRRNLTVDILRRQKQPR